MTFINFSLFISQPFKTHTLYNAFCNLYEVLLELYFVYLYVCVCLNIYRELFPHWDSDVHPLGW